MKITFVNTWEGTGGAAIAAHRLMKAVQKAGHDVCMIVKDKESQDKEIISVNGSFIYKCIGYVKFVWERVVIFFNNKFNRANLFKVSIANTGFDISKKKEIKDADIIHIHWINQGLLSLKDIKKLIETGKPIIWTLHDMWPCTGICHHAYSCDKYTAKCGCCHLLNSEKEDDLSHKIWEKKQFLNNSNITIVAVSSWLENVVHRSSLMNRLETVVFSNVIDTDIFIPYDKMESRNLLSLPKDKKILLMGAARLDDEIKGAIYLKKALTFLSQEKDIMLVLFGNIKDQDVFFNDISIPYIYLGLIRDTNKIVRLYSAVDITVTPSLYETFGQTISEAMACGCPVVSFNNSGQTDIIDHKVNGYLAEYYDANDLAIGIDWILNNANYDDLAINARKKVVETFSENIVTEQYIELYKKKMN